jgi:oligoendopeptidase F
VGRARASAYRRGFAHTATIIMKRTALAIALTLGFLAAAPQTRAADAPANPPAVWNLSSIYADDAAWEAARVKLLARMPELRALQGTMGTSAAALLHAMDTISGVQREATRLHAYAHLKADADTQVNANQARNQLAEALNSQFQQAISFEAAEVSAIGPAKIDAYIAAEPKLKVYAYALHTMLRLAGHTLSQSEEALLAAAAEPLDQVTNIYELLNNADLPWPKLTVHGKAVTLDPETYVALREDRDAKVREQVFKTFWPVYKAYERTIGAIYATHLHGTVFNARARKYENSLALAQSQDNTPEAVYRTLVAETNAGLPTLQRYLKLRSRLLGLKTAKYSDIYVPLANPPRQYTLAEGEALTLAAVAPLGEDYVKALGQHFQESWMDAAPRRGKRGGAYMEPEAYDVHPFVLLSFNGNYGSVSTVAHEWGHAMHSVLANATQPYPTADYGLFVAEIPSTTNEMLLADYVAKNARTKEEKIYALSQQLELLRGTFFRQAMFAEFELKAHEAVEKGQALTGEDLTKIYLDLIRRYHGDAQGVMKIDDLYGVEWAYIPHFYRDYYVYQYATSISAAAYFAEGIGQGDAALRTRYLDMLKAGGSDDPYLVVKKAGLDMATAAPYQAVVHRMARLCDELDALTGGQPAAH